jgi:hypothetical protein
MITIFDKFKHKGTIDCCQAMTKAHETAGSCETGIAVWRQNSGDWIACLEGCDARLVDLPIAFCPWCGTKIDFTEAPP